MKKIVLRIYAAVLFFCSIDNALAARATESTSGCGAGYNLCGTCGNGCEYKRATNGDVIISNPKNFSGDAIIDDGAFDGEYGFGIYGKLIINGNFETIGDHAFFDNTPTNIVFNGTVKTIECSAFDDALSQVSGKVIVLPEGLETLKEYAFAQNKDNATLILPSSLETIEEFAFGCDEWEVSTVNIQCNGDDDDCERIRAMLKDYKLYDETTTNDLYDRFTLTEDACEESQKYYYDDACYRIPEDEADCYGNEDYYYYNGAECVKYFDGDDRECSNGYNLLDDYSCVNDCGNDYYAANGVCEERQNTDDCSEFSADSDTCSKCDDGYLEKNGSCISASVGCGKNYRQIENWCNRIRYTPAEAAKVLKNDNTNEVTITFKK